MGMGDYGRWHFRTLAIARTGDCRRGRLRALAHVRADDCQHGLLQAQASAGTSERPAPDGRRA